MAHPTPRDISTRLAQHSTQAADKVSTTNNPAVLTLTAKTKPTLTATPPADGTTVLTPTPALIPTTPATPTMATTVATWPSASPSLTPIPHPRRRHHHLCTHTYLLVKPAGPPSPEFGGEGCRGHTVAGGGDDNCGDAARVAVAASRRRRRCR